MHRSVLRKPKQISVVMPGLDPGIHSVAVEVYLVNYGMDCRVKPGNDDKNSARLRLSLFLYSES